MEWYWRIMPRRLRMALTLRQLAREVKREVNSD